MKNKPSRNDLDIELDKDMEYRLIVAWDGDEIDNGYGDKLLVIASDVVVNQRYPLQLDKHQLMTVFEDLRDGQAYGLIYDPQSKSRKNRKIVKVHKVTKQIELYEPVNY
jgi:hypothetical protein